jgi:superfamily II DNA or RNA helicase/HKD family nuclease
MTNEGLTPGLYDELITTRLAAVLGEIGAEVRELHEADQPHRLSSHVAHVLASHLPGVPEGDRARLVADLLDLVGMVDALGRRRIPERPDIPLSAHDLLVNGRGEPQLAAELKKEIASADGIDLIVAFVRWYGVRLLFDALQEARQNGVPVRLLTTTYTGSTEKEALDRLVSLGVDVRVSYDTAITRLHAKAWLFHRRTGFSTAYVGSSNVTRSALLDGREWNVRLSKAASPALFDKIRGAFESHWASQDFEPYDPRRDADRLSIALGRATSASGKTELSGLALHPWPYQEEILEALDSERRNHGSWRNLVVAPTGTGKTVVAALDYRRLRAELGGDPSLLFVAHRERILTQSARAFREALSDGSFGELYVGGKRPERGRHVFASVQTLHANDPTTIDPTAFDVVIVDEFHHAEASTYQRLLDHLQPRVLLALTATPERSDGLDIRRWTNGRTAFDMRLWHALDRQLLAPFQYFGVADTADLTSVRWEAGKYNVGDLGRIYTGNDVRANLVVRQVRRIVADPRQMRALGFCATVEHAEYMAAFFSERGLPSVALSASTPEAVRNEQVRRLARGELSAIFSRDVFNEGVDIPSVDTILLLRPTESATVFLQQIGRGLRRHEAKEVCTVLDFVANYRKEFRFDLRLRALTGINRRDLAAAAEEGFPYLPTGCHIELERQAREWIIEHLKASIGLGAVALRRELQMIVSTTGTAPTLQEFIAEAGVDLEDVGKAGGWVSLRRAVGVETRPPSELEPMVARGAGRVYHLDDTERLDRWAEWLDSPHPPVIETMRERRLAWMLLVTVFGLRESPDSLEAAMGSLWATEPVLDELRETLQILRGRVGRVSLKLPDPDVPLHIGATYARDEILAGFGKVAPGNRYAHQAGPWWDEATRTAVLFITTRKNERDYSPQTLYKDYAISRDLFHWESQHSTAIKSAQGQRYLNQRANGARILLAVREAKQDPWGATMPYLLLGPADYVSHEGERPIAITWRLQNPIPADAFETFKLAVA